MKKIYFNTAKEYLIAENHVKDNNYQYTILGYSTEIATVIRHNFKKVGKSKFKDEETLHPCKEAKANALLLGNSLEMFKGIVFIAKKHGYQWTYDLIEKILDQGPVSIEDIEQLHKKLNL